MSDNNLHPVLQSLKPVVKGIAKTFGKDCEVVLHDITDPYHSIVAIENAHVTGRGIGGPMSEINIEVVRQGGFKTDQINYTKKTPDGRVLKSSTIVIRDSEQQPIGCLCVNFDLSAFIVVRNSINELTTTDKEDGEDEGITFENTNINDILCSLIDAVLENSGKPVAYMSKDDKVGIIKMLDQKGAFMIKGAIDYVAKTLCVSRYTIYNYLDEVRVSEQP